MYSVLLHKVVAGSFIQREKDFAGSFITAMCGDGMNVVFFA